MFEAKKKTYSRQSLVKTTNMYGEDIESYTAAADIHMFLSLSNESVLQSNDMRIQQCSHIGLTKDAIEVGDLIDEKYEVQFVNNAGREKIVFMKEIENNGTFS